MTNPIADPLVEHVISADVAAAPVRLDDTADGVATVTICRAARRNAFDSSTILGLTEIFETLKGAEGVRIVFIRGEGGVFSAGADLDWMRAAAEHSESDNREDAMTMARMLKTLSEIPGPTVALIESAAFGGGAGVAAACDLAVTTKAAKFSFSEVRLGLIPATISPYVVNAIGPRHARPLFATGRVFDAAFAEKIGLVHEVVADAAGLDAARDRLVSEIMACAPGAVASM